MVRAYVPYINVIPTPNCNPFLPSSPLLTTNGSPKFSSNLPIGCAYTSPTPAAMLGHPFPISPTAPPTPPFPKATNRPPLRNACARSGDSAPTRGSGAVTLTPPAAYTSPPTASRPSCGPSPPSWNTRTSVGPPSWNLSLMRLGAVGPVSPYPSGSGSSAPARNVPLTVTPVVRGVTPAISTSDLAKETSPLSGPHPASSETVRSR